jgi:hypothetical protein
MIIKRFTSGKQALWRSTTLSRLLFLTDFLYLHKAKFDFGSPAKNLDDYL